MAEIGKSEDFVTIDTDNFLIRALPGRIEIALLSSTIEKIDVSVSDQGEDAVYRVSERQVIRCRILMTPHLVKDFLGVLGRTIERYESQFGKMEIEEERPGEPGTEFYR